MNAYRIAPLLLLCGVVATPAVAQETESEERVHRNRTRIVVGGMGKGFIGVQVLPLTPELRAHFGVPEDVGVLVSSVEEGGPAETAGILVGDIVSAVDGESVDGAMSLSALVRRKEGGDSVTLELYRDGALQSFPVVVGERERRVFELGGGYSMMPGMRDKDVFITMDDFHLDGEAREAMRDAMRELGDRFDSSEWQERLQRFEELDFSAIQDRMREVEKRLKELEQELQDSERRNRDPVDQDQR